MKRLFIGSIVTLIILEAGSYVINQVLLMPAYQAVQGVWRPDMASKLYIFQIIFVVEAVIFTYIFARGYESRGIMEGIRYGAIIGIFTQLPGAYGQYAIYPIPYDLARSWFVYGFLESVVMGIGISIVFSRVK